jgi:Zn-finger nucleic acid-binding protein
MRCPLDGTTLAMAERAGVEIDYCPQCRGVWLDRGELDRIIERCAGVGYERETGRGNDRDQNGREHHHDRRDHEDDEYRGGRDEQPRRKRSAAFTTLTDLLGGGGD